MRLLQGLVSAFQCSLEAVDIKRLVLVQPLQFCQVKFQFGRLLARGDRFTPEFGLSQLQTNG